MHTPEPITGTVLIIDAKERIPAEKAIFEDAGLRVVSATTTEEGLRLARESKPDLVVSEVMLEKPDAGFVLGYQMKKDPALADVPLVLLSSIFQATGTVFDLNTPESRQWIKADVYMERPVTPDRLISRVRTLLHKV
ncbi:MAG: response regulator [Armatimonadota bacterium]